MSEVQPPSVSQANSNSVHESSSNLQKIQTSVQSLDSLFGGGIPQNSNILLYGEPMCGKKILLMQYIYEGLKAQIPGMFILTDFGYTDWKNKMQNLNMDLTPFEESGLLKVVDCYSKQFEPSLQNTDSIKFAASPSALSNISLLISETQAQILEISQNHRLAFCSLSSLLEESNTQDFYKFMQLHVGKFRKNGATSLFTMEKGMHDSKEIIMIEHLMDGMVEFEDGKIRAKGFGASNEYNQYSITDSGIQLG